MRIWVPDSAAGENCFTSAAEKPSDAESTRLVVVTRSDGDRRGARTLLLTPQLCGDLSFLASLDPDSNVYLTINGLGPNCLRSAIESLGATRTVLTFDADPVDDSFLVEQLAWLSWHAEFFAIRTRDEARARLAAAFHPDAVILTAAQVPAALVAGLSRIAAMRRPGAVRPMSGEEIDAVAGAEASLGVTVPLASGDVLAAEHMTVVVAPARGISPRLAGWIAGRPLRYPVAPGEALTFGHLE